MATTAIILNWEELEVSRDSVRLLLKEPEVEQVILVDNGSHDGSREYYMSLTHPKFLAILLPENQGASIARNRGLAVAKGDTIFLLDGDILYVKGTIAEYQKVLDHSPEAGCVGQHNHDHLRTTGHNGVKDISQADIRMSEEYKVESWFPMAWVQYGLFRGDMLRSLKFHDQKPFDSWFYGFEDDWLYHDMREAGYTSLSVTKPTYYHQAHSGIKEIMKSHGEEAYRAKFAECKKAFEKRWGVGSDWASTLSSQKPSL